MSSPGPSFSPTPSLDDPVRVDVATDAPAGVPIGHVVAADAVVPAALGATREQLAAAGFTGKDGAVHRIVDTAGRLVVAAGIDTPATVDGVRNAAATLARAAAHADGLAVVVPPVEGIDAEAIAQAIVEGAVLARYRYESLRSAPSDDDRRPLARLTLVVEPAGVPAASAGAARGEVYSRATATARDLANTPHSHLTATTFATLVEQLGADRGLDVEVFEQEALIEMGLGGLLAINAGSAEPARLVKVAYRPADPTGHLALVGKGVMYDSGGISLKPSDRIHAQMKNDMSGAAAVLTAIAALPALGCTTSVTGYLVCTDNMPSGTATGLGDVITIRGGTTVEMIDTDAEGRVIMADALVLAREDGHDAVVDIATLTGSAMRALGTDLAAVVGNDRRMIELVQAAATATSEAVWELPLHRPYRTKLDSNVADICNCAPIGQPDALLASLFLAEFVGDLPWAHVDMCGQAQNDDDRTWHPAGCTGWGARLLIEVALGFVPPPSA